MYEPSSTVAVTMPDAFVLPRPNADPPVGVAETLPPESPDPPDESSRTVSVCVENGTVVGAFTTTPVWVIARDAYVMVTS